MSKTRAILFVVMVHMNIVALFYVNAVNRKPKLTEKNYPYITSEIDRIDRIREFQKDLNKWKRNYRLPEIAEDGEYGKETYKAHV